ncbi:MAG: TIGR01212 family radical SAM protein [Desulfobacterales bacterium]
MKKRYTDLNGFLKAHFGCRVQKITVDAGLSCPNRDGTLSTGGCIYCNARGSGTGAHGRGQSVTDQLLQGKAALFRRYKAQKFIAYFQSFSNTYAPLPHLHALYEEALAVDGVVGLSVGTRPDCVDDAVLALLEDLARNRMVWIEYGLQSACDRTLAQINRGHDAACFSRAVDATRGRGIRICAHVILGLPGEGRREMMETADFVSKAGIDGVKIHLLYVARGTELERMYRSGDYRCLDQDEYVSLVCEFIERLPEKVVIQRLTGDPHRNELVAPAWSLDKTGTLAMIRQRLEETDAWQGKRHVSLENAPPARIRNPKHEIRNDIE